MIPRFLRECPPNIKIIIAFIIPQTTEREKEAIFNAGNCASILLLHPETAAADAAAAAAERIFDEYFAHNCSASSTDTGIMEIK